jgi:hypothetical protein
MMKGRNILAATSPLTRWCILTLGVALLAALPKTHAATFTYTNPSCTTFAVSGSPPTQTVTCMTSTAGTPTCAPTVSPASPMAIGQSATITANCSNQPTSYTWTGGGCGTNGSTTCTVTKSRGATIIFTVSGTNGAGTGSAAQISVTWQ